MKNHDTDAAWAYHNGTKHSYQSIRGNPHYLDWENQPLPFKIYPELEPIALSQASSSSGNAGACCDLRVCRELGKVDEVNPRVDSWRRFFFSPPALRGAELIRAARFCFARRLAPARSITSICISSAASLRTLRRECITSARRTFHCGACAQGDFRAVLVAASGAEPRSQKRRAVIVALRRFGATPGNIKRAPTGIAFGTTARCSPIFWPQRRLAIFPHMWLLGFVDASVSQLLALDDQREAALSLVALGTSHRPATDQLPRQPVHESRR